jgi:16S rRNA (cytidine1402-2'-O)-methyltransferase
VVRRKQTSSGGAAAEPPASPAFNDDVGEGNGDAAATSQLTSRISLEIAHLLGKRREPGLYLVATPIGNLGDITLRALAVLATADVIYAEDTRHSGKLLSHFGIRTKLRLYHEHNAERERPNLLAALAQGARIALISDAGTPLVSDPGFKLVRECVAAGHRVMSLPGPSALLAALVASGLPTDAFLFAGFLPSRQRARRGRLAELAEVPATLVFFESPSRVAETLADLADVLGERSAVVARELTKLNEELARASLDSLAQEFKERGSVKGEIVIVVGPPQDSGASEGEIEARLTQRLTEMSLKDAARTVALELGVPRKRAYELALRLQRQVRESGGNGG